MLDSDLAGLYRVTTKRLNEQVKRNTQRFPEHFMFKLTELEYLRLRSQIVSSSEIKNLRSQIVTSTDKNNLRSQNATSSHIHGGRRYLPYVFTEEGVAMFSGVLKSKTAVNVSIQIIDAFVAMRRFISKNAELFERLDCVEQK